MDLGAGAIPEGDCKTFVIKNRLMVCRGRQRSKPDSSWIETVNLKSERRGRKTKVEKIQEAKKGAYGFNYSQKGRLTNQEESTKIHDNKTTKYVISHGRLTCYLTANSSSGRSFKRFMLFFA